MDATVSENRKEEKTINERVKEIRPALGLSGAKFGETLGVSRTAISLIETGKKQPDRGYASRHLPRISCQ